MYCWRIGFEANSRINSNNNNNNRKHNSITLVEFWCNVSKASPLDMRFFSFNGLWAGPFEWPLDNPSAVPKSTNRPLTKDPLFTLLPGMINSSGTDSSGVSRAIMFDFSINEFKMCTNNAWFPAIWILINLLIRLIQNILSNSYFFGPEIQWQK